MYIGEKKERAKHLPPVANQRKRTALQNHANYKYRELKSVDKNSTMRVWHGMMEKHEHRKMRIEMYRKIWQGEYDPETWNQDGSKKEGYE